MLGLGLTINRQRVMGGPSVPPATINSVAIDNTAPTVGDTLTATVDATGADSITYQWKADGVNIGGETAQTYLTTRVGAMGRAITVTVIAHKTGAANSAPTTSSATDAVKGAPEFTENPVLTTDGANAPGGPPNEGDTITSTPGVFTGYPSPVVNGYIWRDAGGTVAAGVDNTFIATPFHSPIYCRVEIQNAVSTVTADSNSM